MATGKKQQGKKRKEPYQWTPVDLNKRAGEPWERLPEETSRNFQWFLEYRNQEPLRRAMQKVADKFDTSLQYVGRLSSKFHWVKRCEAWDSYCAEISTLAIVNDHIETRKFHATISREALEILRLPLQALQEKINEQRFTLEELKSLGAVELIEHIRENAKLYGKLVEVERISKGMTSKDIGVRSQDELFAKLLDELEHEFKEIDEHGAKELIRKSKKPGNKTTLKTGS